MKVYVSDTQYQTHIKNRFKDRIELVDNKAIADTLITGSYQTKDYSLKNKTIIIPYTGHDNIDISLLYKKKMHLFNTTVHSRYVAEKAVQLMQALLGNTIHYHKNMQQGDWSNRNNKDRVSWVSTFDKRIGIFGYGRIGQWIQKLLEPYTNHFYTLDRGKNYPNINTVPTLEALLKTVDIVFVATPHTASTEHAFNDALLKQFKNGYIVNVARGKIIDQHALYQRLTDNTLKGFASDVWYNYPKQDRLTFPAEVPLHTLSNVVMSPHCAALTDHAKTEMMDKVMEHLNNILQKDFSEALDLKRLN